MVVLGSSYLTTLAYPFELSVCAIFRNEAPYLKEWIEFHKLAGVQHFVLYNNLSTDSFQDVLKPYIEDQIVELYDWDWQISPGVFDWQIAAYNDGLEKLRAKSKWVAFIDIDEFLFPTLVDNLQEFLKKYESFGGLGAEWVMYGTSGVKKMSSNGLYIESLIWRAPESYPITIKSIVQTRYVDRMISAHTASYKTGYYQVNARTEKFEGQNFIGSAKDLIRINHYWTRDESYLHNIKIPRRLEDMGNSVQATLDIQKDFNSIIDTAIYKYLEHMHRIMGL